MTLDPYYSAYHWIDGPARTAERVKALRGAGIERLEFGSLDRYEPELVPLLATLAGSCLLHNYFPPPAEPFVFNLASASTNIRSRSMRLAMEAIRLSGDLSAPCYAVHAGFVTDPTGFDGISFIFPSPADEGERRRAYARFVTAVNELLPIAAAAHVTLLIENNVCPPRLRGRLLLQTPDEFDQLFSDVHAPDESLGVLLDSGHLNVTSRTFGFPPLAFVDRHRERILGLHLHDNDGAEDLHGRVARGGTAWSIANAADHVRWVTIEAKCRSLDEIRSQLALVSGLLQVRGQA